MKPFDLEAAMNGAKLVTRDGREAVFIAYDPLAKSAKVVARVGDYLGLYKENGIIFTQETSCGDLFMATTKRTVYVNFYKNGQAYWYYSSKDAAASVSQTAVAVAVPVGIEE